jgi:hypothetical protein
MRRLVQVGLWWALALGALMLDAGGGAAAGALTAPGAPASRPLASPLTVTAPASGALVTRLPTRITVQFAHGVTGVSIRLNGRRLPGRTHKRSVEATVTRASHVRTGLNELLVQGRRGGRKLRIASSFVLAGKRSGLASLSVRGHEPFNATLKMHAPRRRVKIEVLVNGHRVLHAFDDPRPFPLARRVREAPMRLHLSPSDGLRGGRNALRVLLWRTTGRWLELRRTLRVATGIPLAAAGPSRVVRGTHWIRLDGSASLPAVKRDRLTYRWKVISAPRGARPKLHTAGLKRPRLHVDRPGRYELRLVVTEHRRGHGTRTASDVVTLQAQPTPPPPIGEQIDTLVRQLTSTGECVALNGQCIQPPSGYGIPTFQFVALNAQTLVVDENNAVASTTLGIEELAGDIKNAPAGDFVVVSVFDYGNSGPFGQCTGSCLTDLQNEFASIGATLPTQFGEGPYGGGGFSVIGAPGLAPGQAWESSYPAPNGQSVGDVEGYLTPTGDPSNTDAPYTFVPNSYLVYNTAAPGAPANGASIQISSVSSTGAQQVVDSCQGSLPAGEAGFLVDAVDAGTGMSTNYAPDCQAIPTNGPGGEFSGQAQLASQLEAYSQNPFKIVLLQSIGDPQPNSQAWTAIANAIGSLGGTADLFNRMDGTFGYAFVGGAALETPGAEAVGEAPYLNSSGQMAMQTLDQQAQLTGLLARNHQNVLQPISSDTTGFINNQLLPIAYGQPSSFTLPATKGQKNAMAFIATTLFPCQPNEQNCTNPTDVRPLYYQLQGQNIDWGGTALHDLKELCYPWSHGCKDSPLQKTANFSQKDLSAMQQQLETEFPLVATIQSYFGSPGTENGTLNDAIASAPGTILDLQSTATSIEDAAKTPGTANTSGALYDMMLVALQAASSFYSPLEEISGISSSDVNPDNNAGIGLMSNVFWIAGGLSGGSPYGSISTQEQQLEDEVNADFTARQAGVAQLLALIVSDPTKLATLAGDFNSTDLEWKVNVAYAQHIMQFGAMQWFYNVLMPGAWTAYRLTKSPGNTFNADNFFCHTGVFSFPFQNMAPGGQYSLLWDWENTSSGVGAQYFTQALGHGDIYGGGANPQFDYPAATTLQQMFSSPATTESDWTSGGQDAGVGLIPGRFWTQNYPNPTVPSQCFGG